MGGKNAGQDVTGSDVAACPVDPARASATLPRKPARVERALDLALQHDCFLKDAVDVALTSWTETILTEAARIGINNADWPRADAANAPRAAFALDLAT